MKKMSILWVVALLFSGCPPSIDTPAVTDPYVAFKADSNLRFEGVECANLYTHVFISDKGGLFSSEKNRVGYSSYTADEYCFIEWENDVSIGVKTNPKLRTQNGVINLYSLEIIKKEKGLLWIVYKLSVNIEGRCVVPWHND